MLFKKPSIPVFEKMVAPLRAVPKAAMKQIRSFAGREALIFKHKIENQEFESFDATPLSDEWLAFKIKNNLDLRTLIATKNFINHIRVFVKKTGPHTTTVYIGFDEEDKAIDPITKEKTPFHLYILAAVQEYGSQKAHVPPRPTWGPQLTEIQERAKALRAKMMKLTPEKKGTK